MKPVFVLCLAVLCLTMVFGAPAPAPIVLGSSALLATPAALNGAVLLPLIGGTAGSVTGPLALVGAGKLALGAALLAGQ